MLNHHLGTIWTVIETTPILDTDRIKTPIKERAIVNTENLRGFISNPMMPLDTDMNIAGTITTILALQTLFHHLCLDIASKESYTLTHLHLLGTYGRQALLL